MLADLELALLRLEAGDDRLDFSSGDPDLDEFYRTDSIAACKELLCVTYALMEGEKVAAFFSVSNDAIKKEDVPRSAFQRVTNAITHSKRYSTMPAAKIGRFGVSTCRQRSGCGTQILDFLKVWFTTGNKTGCRFLVVDAYNNPKALGFYQKNGFRFLTGNDAGEETRTMYFDLITFRSD